MQQFVDRVELAKYCLTVSEGVWCEGSDKPQSQIRYENKITFKPHNHQGIKNPKTYVNTQPFMVVKDHEGLLGIWRESWLRMDKLRKELQALERAA